MNKTEGYEQFYNLHKGEVGLIVANGPGLENIPIEFLKKYPSLGCNRITLMAPEFVPTYYSCIGFNQVDTPEKRATFDAMLGHPDCKAAFINRLFAHHFAYDNIFTIMGGRYYGIENTRFFSLDPLNITGLGFTMTFVLLQIAFYMGFSKVLIVGLDHHYDEGPKKHFYTDDEVADFEVAPGPLYRNDTDLWQQGADLVFQVARKVYEDAGREIINLSIPSACEIFRKQELSRWHNPQ